MLVLTRKRGQTIVIGNDIFITVVEIDGDKVKLGIEAPKDISVYRKEIFEAIAAENRSAAGALPEQVSELARLVKSCGDKEE